MPRGKLRFYDLFKWAGVIHRDIGSMSLCDLNFAVRGYFDAQPGSKPRGKGNMSEDRLSELGIEGF